MQRMRAADRRQAILQAAGELFTARGYSGVTMEDVLSEVGGSKATLYKHFSDKTELFRAAVESLLDERSVPLRAFTPQEGADLAATLRALGEHFAAVALAPEAIALHRLVTAETERVPGLGEAFFAHGPSVGRTVLAAHLRRACEDGLIAVADPVQAGSQLYQMMLGDAQMRLLTGSPDRPTDAEIKKSIALAVDVFLHGVALRPPGAVDPAERDAAARTE